MLSPSRDRECEQLEQELLTVQYQEMLWRLQKAEPFLRQFETWADVVAFMRRGTSRDTRKDEILRPIFRAHRSDQESGWLTILLAIFWPRLESISRWKRHWEDDPDDGSDELRQNIVWAFFQVVCRLDIDRRPARLVQKIINDTFHRVYEGYRHRWDRTNREVLMEPNDLAELAPARAPDLDEAIDLLAARERETERLRGHLDAGCISEECFLMVVGTRLLGQSLADYAREMGLNYEAAKKRRQRAEAAIRRSEEQMP